MIILNNNSNQCNIIADYSKVNKVIREINNNNKLIKVISINNSQHNNKQEMEINKYSNHMKIGHTNNHNNNQPKIKIWHINNRNNQCKIMDIIKDNIKLVHICTIHNNKRSNICHIHKHNKRHIHHIIKILMLDQFNIKPKCFKLQIIKCREELKVCKK